MSCRPGQRACVSWRSFPRHYTSLLCFWRANCLSPHTVLHGPSQYWLLPPFQNALIPFGLTWWQENQLLCDLIPFTPPSPSHTFYFLSSVSFPVVPSHSVACQFPPALSPPSVACTFPTPISSRCSFLPLSLSPFLSLLWMKATIFPISIFLVFFLFRSHHKYHFTVVF